MSDSPVLKKIEPPHYMVGRVLQSRGRLRVVFKVVSVNGRNAYGWEVDGSDETWTWYSLEELHDVRRWNLI